MLFDSVLPSHYIPTLDTMPPISLLSLPRELRDEIYRHVLKPPFTSTFDNMTNGNNDKDIMNPIITGPDFETLFPSLPPICRISKQLYHETTPLYLSHCTLHFSDAKSTIFLLQWLFEFGPSVHRYIQRLRLDEFTEASACLLHALLPQLKSLITLHLSLYTSTPTSRPIRYNSAEDISLPSLISSHRLDRILELDRLESLTFVFRDLFESREKEHLCHMLKGWFWNEFCRRGRMGVSVRHSLGQGESDSDSDSFEGCMMFD